jgi:hypothetical protein
MLPGTTYYPSPGGILEEVESVLVEIDPTFVNAPLEPLCGFSTSGRVRAIEARQLLRAAQVGGLPDARLEINVHDLLLRLAVDRGPWIGDEIDLARSAVAVPATLEDLLAHPGRRSFERADASHSTGFLDLRCSTFEEIGAAGVVVRSQRLEYVVPRRLGTNTLVAAVLARGPGGEPLFGVDEDDLPAAQGFSGNSNLLVAPAWRVPRGLGSLAQARDFALERLSAEYGVDAEHACDLGGPYRPSPGLTPEVVHPVVFTVRAIAQGPRALAFIPLSQLIARRDRVPDGHLRVAALRVSHALGTAATTLR